MSPLVMPTTATATTAAPFSPMQGLEILQRQHKTLGLSTSWKPFQYVIKDCFLCEYRVNAQLSVDGPLQVIDLRDCRMVSLDSAVGCFTFSLITKSGKSLTFKCPTQASRDRWHGYLAPYFASSAQAEKERERPHLPPSSASAPLLPCQLSPSPSYTTALSSHSADDLSLKKRPFALSPNPVISSSTLTPAKLVVDELPDLDSFIGAVVVGSLMGSIVAVNSEAERLFGYSRAELVGESISKLMPEPYKSQHDGYLFRHEKFGTEKLLGRTRQLLGEHKDGSSFPIIISLGKLQYDGYYLANFKEVH